MLERRRVPEIMDDPALDPAAHDRALRGLARINALSLPEHALAAEILNHFQHGQHGAASASPVRILDVAAGSGDVPLRVARRLHRSGLTASVIAVDISERAIDACRARAKRAFPDVNADFRVLDVLNDSLPEAEIATCSLFAHHLDEDDVVTLLSSMARAASRLVLLNDLERSGLGLLAAKAIPRLLTRSPVVHTDAVRSVHAAWTPAELRALADRAGLENASIHRTFPCRMLLSWAPNPINTADAAPGDKP